MRGSISGKSGTGERAWVYQPDYLGTVRYVTKIQCPFVLLLRDPHSPRMSFRNNADLGKGVPRGMFNMVPGTPLFFLFGKRPGHRFSRLHSEAGFSGFLVIPSAGQGSKGNALHLLELCLL